MHIRSYSSALALALAALCACSKSTTASDDRPKNERPACNSEQAADVIKEHFNRTMFATIYGNVVTVARAVELPKRTVDFRDNKDVLRDCVALMETGQAKNIPVSFTTEPPVGKDGQPRPSVDPGHAVELVAVCQLTNVVRMPGGCCTCAAQCLREYPNLDCFEQCDPSGRCRAPAWDCGPGGCRPPPYWGN